MGWNDSGVTPGGVKLKSSTQAHYKISLVIFTPDKFNLKWETESQQQKQGVSESWPLTNTPARFMCNMYTAHIFKYLVNWRNYTKRALNLKWPYWGSSDIPKLIFLHAQLENASHACFDWYLETSKRGNDRVVSLQETNKKLLDTIFPGSSAGKESACNAGDPSLRRRDRLPTPVFLGFPGGSDGKRSICNVGDLGLIPGLGRSPGGEHGNPLQYSWLENPHGQRSLAGYSPQGCKESDMTEQLSTAQHVITLW